MSTTTVPVIVTYQKLNTAITKALAKDPAEVLKAVQNPRYGFEANEEPPSAADVAALTGELASALSVLQAEEKVPGNVCFRR
jgi:hypothetical protein